MPTETWESVLHERGSFIAHEAARRFLSEFGGLVTYEWPADSVTTSSAIRFDPFVAEFARASREAGASLHPVGAVDEDASFRGISEDGALHLVRDRAELLSTTTDQALDRLVAARVPGYSSMSWARRWPGTLLAAAGHRGDRLGGRSEVTCGDRPSAARGRLVPGSVSPHGDLGRRSSADR